MARVSGMILIVVVSSIGIQNAQSAATQGKRCTTPPLAPVRIERVIGQCQDEIKLAILTEALQVLQDDPSLGKSRSKRETFSEDEKKIAGCLLQCVYRKVKAVDTYGFPTTEGLVRLYTEGVNEQGYFLATLQAVQGCLKNAQQKHFLSAYQQEATKTCDVAYDVFECVSDTIGEYCGRSP